MPVIPTDKTLGVCVEGHRCSDVCAEGYGAFERHLSLIGEILSTALVQLVHSRSQDLQQLCGHAGSVDGKKEITSMPQRLQNMQQDKMFNHSSTNEIF